MRPPSHCVCMLTLPTFHCPPPPSFLFPSTLLYGGTVHIYQPPNPLFLPSLANSSNREKYQYNTTTSTVKSRDREILSLNLSTINIYNISVYRRSEMDMYGFTAPDFFRIDDLLDFSNDQIFSSSTTTTDSDHRHPPNSSQYPNNSSSTSSVADTLMEPQFHCSNSTDFTSDLCVPNDDVAELEWLSNFVHDSNTYFPANEFTGTANLRSDAPFHGRSRSKRSKAPSKNNSRTSLPESRIPIIAKCNNRQQEENQNSPVSSTGTSHSETRRCTHCASEKTPQWRTGPLGPKTLCNACGVRFKSGRLVPEYRPAASPTFVLTKHSNSHRKVMELRRQKEEQQQIRRHSNFEVC